MATREQPQPWRNRIVGYGTENPEQLAAHPKNWRIHAKSQQDAFLGAVSEIGVIQDVIVSQRSGYIIDGHMRVMLALRTGQPLIPVKYVDLDEREEDLALATLDPIGAMAAVDAQKLDELLKDFSTNDAGLQALLDELADSAGLAVSRAAGEDGEPPETALDRAEALQKQYGVELGQLWIIPSRDGARTHRLLCGDTRDEANLDRLMDGKKAGLLHTDPPYGISIVAPKGLATAGQVGGSKSFGSKTGATSGTTRKSSTGFDSAGLTRGVTAGIKTKPSDVKDIARPTLNVGSVQRGPKSPNQIIQSNVYPVIQGDDEPFDPTPLLGFAPVVVLWGANYYADKLPISSCWICWDKREGITRNSFADCELAWCSKSGPARIFHHLWNGLHKGSQHGERRTHPTEKPVALFEEMGKLYADGGLWVDLYAGTGAQMLAAERTGATCYACEIEPLYVACILDRMTRMGLEPRMMSNG